MTLLTVERPARAERRLLFSTARSGPLGCGEANVDVDGRPGGLAVASDGTILLAIASPGSIWRLQGAKGHAPALPAQRIDEVAVGPGVLTPAGLATGPDGTLFVADANGHRVWAVAPNGGARIVAGSVYGYRDGEAGQALFRYPSDVAIGPDGTCYVADAGNHRIRTISPEGLVATLAGSIYDYGTGRGPDGRFRQPLALDVDAEGTCYVADTGNNAIRRVTPDGEVTTVAGSPPGGDADGVGADVGLRWPSGVAAGLDGLLWVADHGNGALRRVGRHGESTTALRLTGRRSPAAVALTPDGEVVVAVEVLDNGRRLRTCLLSSSLGVLERPSSLEGRASAPQPDGGPCAPPLLAWKEVL